MNRHLQSGVSLLEALVALVIVAIGAVSVVGMQATLRFNADVAKQRSEAVRLAQVVIEQWRGFTTFAPIAGQLDWTMISSTGAPTAIVGTNTTFNRSISVVERGTADDDPLSKVVHVDVSWTDRTGQAQSVAVNTIIGGVVPELGGSLSVPMDLSLLRNPAGRHPAIPHDAITQPDGTSNFTPPNSGGNYWVFDNTSGLIVHLCPPPPGLCDDTNAVPLMGFVMFATGTTQPTPALAENPVEAPIAGVQVMVDEDTPIDQDIACYHFYGSNYISYFCAVPTNLSLTSWSGQARVTGLDIPSSFSDHNDSKYKVCRYTPVRNCQPTVGSTIWGAPVTTLSCSGSTPTANRKMANQDHPLNYSNAGSPLVNQNFLVIRSGFGGLAFDCPDDDVSTPNLLGNTWRHQPDH